MNLSGPSGWTSSICSWSGARTRTTSMLVTSSPPISPVFPGDGNRHRPTRSREVLAKCGIELPKPLPRPLPDTVYIGEPRTGTAKMSLTRPELFNRVWTEPIMTVAQRWGMSDNGLRKACRRVNVPVPPRGYWAKVAAGQCPKRPALPRLAAGEAEEIVIWASVGEPEMDPADPRE